VKTIAAKVPDELAEAVRKTAEANGITVSTLIKQALTDATIRDASVEREILHQLHRIGNNLNQIARRCNARRVVDRQTLEALLRVEKELKELLRDR